MDAALEIRAGELAAVSAEAVRPPSEEARLARAARAGDRVAFGRLYARYAGTEFKLDDEELLILSQKDVLAVIQ